jgi:hypothetical protein
LLISTLMTTMKLGKYDQKKESTGSEHQGCRPVKRRPVKHRLATASKDWDIRILDVDSGECIATLRGHLGPVTALVVWQGVLCR